MLSTKRYKHFKNKYYQVYGVVNPVENRNGIKVFTAKYTEDPSIIIDVIQVGNQLFIDFDYDLVLYQAEYGDKDWWVRPVNDFYGYKEHEDGSKEKRFVKV